MPRLTGVLRNLINQNLSVIITSGRNHKAFLSNGGVPLTHNSAEDNSQLDGDSAGC